jgi:transcriptional regulator with XRE-family HTH domain
MYSNSMYERASAKPDAPNSGRTLAGMPRKATPSSPFGRRLMQLRMQRGLTQADLAKLLGSTQRNVSHYETVAEYPPTDVLVKIATVLKVSADQLLGLKTPKAPPKPKEDPETKRLWKRFQQLLSLPEKDQRAVIRLINSLVGARSDDDADAA